MAHIEIVPNHSWQAHYKVTVADERADYEAPDAEPWWFATCTCGASGTDRGNFEDTVQWALDHAEGAHE
jgi:hypothetical protein